MAGAFESAATGEPVEHPFLPAPVAEHDRIVQYDLGELRLLVRYEVNACMPLDQQDQHSEPERQLKTVTSTKPAVANGAQPPAGHSVKLIEGGTFVEQCGIVERKSRSKYARYDGVFWKETAGQLLLSQTPVLVVGMHESGTFYKLDIHTLDELESRRDSRGRMYRLGMALCTIYELVAAQGGGTPVRLYCVGGVLELSQRENRKTQALPDSMLQLFKPLVQPLPVAP